VYSSSDIVVKLQYPHKKTPPKQCFFIILDSKNVSELRRIMILVQGESVEPTHLGEHFQRGNNIIKPVINNVL
jgi:hypothetical protein